MSNQVRIIGGLWRSRIIRFPPIAGLRPTPDRVRETLFNWLRDDIEGAACLDLYAGSGALGFEAASRGAARVVQVEENGVAFKALLTNADILGAAQIEPVRAEVRRFLTTHPETFDVVFLDPPFAADLVLETCALLADGAWLSRSAKIYVESPIQESGTDWPRAWRQIKHKQAGAVSFRLFLNESTA